MSTYIVTEYEKTGLASKHWTPSVVAEGTNLKSVLRAAKNHLSISEKWAKKVQIEARVNNVSVWNTSAAALYAHPYKVLVHNFQRELRIERRD